MSAKNILLTISNLQLRKLIEHDILHSADYTAVFVQDIADAAAYSLLDTVDLAILEIDPQDENAFGFIHDLSVTAPSISIILIIPPENVELCRDAFRLGVFDCLVSTSKPDDILKAIERGCQRREKLKDWAKRQSRKDTDKLRRRVDILETLARLGRLVTASLNLDDVLKSVVDAAVELTDAEEGSLLILDEKSGELIMRAARNFQDDFVKTFRLKADDSLAGEVIRTGKPVLITKDTPEKIKTAYLVKTLIYVPLKAFGRVVGVLGVDNRESTRPFDQVHLAMVSALGEFAAIAVENARLFSNTAVEREKLETILSNIEDGVVVINEDKKVLIANRAARKIFSLDNQRISTRPIDEIFHHEQFLNFLNNGQQGYPYRHEIEIDEQCVVSASMTSIPGVGFAVTMHDITYFKELDRIKGEFVQTVSHDLRSPLTAILGYVELLNRVGPVNERQQGFIDRVQVSIHSITSLINDLLDLGRIESGLDERKELTSLFDIVQYTINSYQKTIDEKDLILEVEADDSLPEIYGDIERLRQAADNLFSNAISYTPGGGKIDLQIYTENEQIVMEIRDSGIGISAEDRPHIFEKFYRGKNVPDKAPGSGLGLSIVKSIIENHQGRIWVESNEGEGAMFTVVLPVGEKET
ncbi:MAG: ATP-binding protein [Chloroflexota bacterium]